MPDAIVSGAANQVLQQGGILGSLLLLALAVIGVLFWQLIKAWGGRADRETAANGRLAEAQEARVVEARETAKMLAEGSANNVVLANTNIARTNALEKVVTGFDLLAAEIRSGRERWGDRADHIEEMLKDILTRLEHMQRNQGGGGRA